METFDVPFVEPVTVDGQSSVPLLAKIEASNPDKRIIHVIWDNAGYHRGPDVRAFLARPDCRIHLIALPPYCPHLNPIERLWKVMQEHVTHNKYYPTQRQFADAILNFFRETIPNGILKVTAAFCRPTPIAVTTGFTMRHANRRQ